MATPLNDHFGPDIATRIAQAISRVHPAFDERAFLSDATHGFDALELTPRARHIAAALGRHLPSDFEEAVRILMASLPPRTESAHLTGMATFFFAPHVYFVAERGLDHWEASMAAQHELTQRFTAEYSIRAFLEREPERTLARLREWTKDPSEDVRRLVSEGTRPRLPWAPRLRGFQLDPSPVLELLELLKDDPSLYVRRSVANNLNDIGKDHPDVLAATCRRWLVDASEERRWMVRHALRSAIKRGDAGALAVLGFGSGGAVEVVDVAIEPAQPRIGGSVRISAVIRNAGAGPTRLNVDLRIHFVKANGGASPKVFKMREAHLGSGERVEASKLISLRQHRTRTHHPGAHRVEIVINGRAHAAGSFLVADPSGAA